MTFLFTSKFFFLVHKILFGANLMNEKKRYRILCDTEQSIPLFSQAWWLDLLVDNEDDWNVSLIEKKGLILAAMPYVIKRKLGFVFLKQPPLTPFLGPWIRKNDVKQANWLATQKKLMRELIKILPKFDYFNQNWHFAQTNWLPFYWAGFSQTTRFTYVIEPISKLDIVWKNFTSSYRNKVRKAQKNLMVKSDINIEKFYQINEMTFQRQRIAVPYSLDLIKKIDLALSIRNQRKIFSAHDRSNNIHSVLYLIWDNTTAYVHMVGENPTLRNSGAGILLIWEAIRYASEQLRIDRFDFEGSMIENVERVRRDCGALQIPYYNIFKIPSHFLRFVKFMRDFYLK